MESIQDPSQNVCRVCNETGHYDLCEMKFRCNDTDVLLIDAYNTFSTLNNVRYLKMNFSVQFFSCSIFFPFFLTG